MKIKKKNKTVKNLDFDQGGCHFMDIGNGDILVIQKELYTNRFHVYKKESERTIDLGIMTEDLINLILKGFNELKYK